MLIAQEEDEDGVRGVRLSKQIMQIAGDALNLYIYTHTHTHIYIYIYIYIHTYIYTYIYV